jgi:hypothetical protein
VSQINTKETRPAELRVRPRPHKQASHFFAVSRTAALAFVPGSYLLPAVLPSFPTRRTGSGIGRAVKPAYSPTGNSSGVRPG